jgi:murein DD-endopeptidase MepM/ murein hydrolase activator NlpD
VAQPHVTSPFGWRTDPVDGRGEQLHRGVDLRGAPGDLVGAIAPGVVEFAGTDPLLGNLVIVDHGQDLRSLYGHLQDLLVHEGLPVDRATTLGLVGNTGRSQAPHLHLSVTVHGVHIDPLRVIGQPFHVPELLVQAAVLAGKALEADQGLGQPSAAHDP